MTREMNVSIVRHNAILTQAVVNGRLVVEFDAAYFPEGELIHGAGTIVCDQPTEQEKEECRRRDEEWHAQSGYDCESLRSATVTRFGLLFWDQGQFTPHGEPVPTPATAPAPSTLQRYGSFRPTGFDPAGAFLPDQQDWLIAPVSRTRDSGPLDESNFDAALKILGGESDTVEIDRFGHWGPGWFELILVDPADADAVSKAERLAERLENYPVLDDDDHSRREWDDTVQSWDDWGCKDFVHSLVEDYELNQATHYFLEDCDRDALYTLFNDNGGEWEYHDDGPHFRFRDFNASREQLAAFIREQRAAARAPQTATE